MGSKIPYPEACGLFLRQIETDPVAGPVSVKARHLSTNFCQVYPGRQPGSPGHGAFAPFAPNTVARLLALPVLPVLL